MIMKEKVAVGPQILTKIIRGRRSVYADDYLDQPIPEEIIREVLINATWAPTFKMTQPWRFIVLQDQQRQPFGDFIAAYYRERLPAAQWPPLREERARNYPSKAACMIVIIMQRHQKVEISEWEEMAAVCCAVQNMALTCEAYHIGGYWDTSAACIAYAQQLDLQSHERCLGFFYMGYYDRAAYQCVKRRTGIDQKVEWRY